MNEILDHTEKKNQKRTFSKLSLINALISLGLFGSLLFDSPETIEASESVPAPSMTFMTAVLLFGLLGVVMTVLSIVKKEPDNWYKWVGGILNILYFLFLTVTAISVAMET